MSVVAIVGSRQTHRAALEQVLVYVRALAPGTVVLSGGAIGIDRAAVKAAKDCGLETREILADWQTHGGAAGFIRNKELVREADRVVAWWDGVSRGTHYTISLAKKARKLERVFRFSKLVVYTARIGCKDPDVMDITRKTGRSGLAFAPSWELLKPFIDKRRAGTMTDMDWPRYVAGYLREMRTSYLGNRAAWTDLLSHKRVVLVCYCNKPECHRFVFAQQVLGPLGVQYGGELTNDPSSNA